MRAHDRRVADRHRRPGDLLLQPDRPARAISPTRSSPASGRWTTSNCGSTCAEIQEFSARLNRRATRRSPSSWPATVLLPRRILPPTISRPLSRESLQAAYAALRRKFYDARCPRSPRAGHRSNVEWRNRMCAALIGRGRRGRLRGSPAGPEPRVLHADRVAARRAHRGRRTDLRSGLRRRPRKRGRPGCGACATRRPRKFIFNFVREYGDLEYVNIGRVIGSLSHRRPPRAAATSTSPRSSSASSEKEIVKHHPHAEVGRPRAPRRGQGACWTRSSSRRSTPSTSSTAGSAAASWA